MGKGSDNDPDYGLRSAPQLFYRTCRSNPPVVSDFYSYYRLGIQLRHDTAHAIDISKGVSFWENEEQARANAVRFPDAGSYVVEVAVPPDVRRRLKATTGHVTFWAEPEALLSWVTGRVVRV